MRSAIVAGGLLMACLCAGCGSRTPAALWARPAGATPAAAASGAVPASTPEATPVAEATTPATRCPQYPASVYGIDPNQVAATGGGAQLVTVVAPTATSRTAALTTWARAAGRCWAPVTFAGQPAPPFLAETGHGGLLPFTRRVPGDWATPTGLYPFGTVIYGNSAVPPDSRYPYHHLVCGDWWNEQPGSPTYDTFQHAPCGTTPPYGGDSEALWTEVQPYQHFIDIKMPTPPDHGAGIFLHDHMAVGYTEGCVALPNAELDAVLDWLNPAAHPHILIAVQ